MDKNFSKNAVWEEIFITSQKEDDSFHQEGFATGSFSITDIRDLFDTSEESKEEISLLKSELKSYLLTGNDISFKPEDHITTDLFGNIHLKTGDSGKLGLYPKFTKSLELEKKLHACLDKIVNFYRGNFVHDEELIELITPIFLGWNRLSDLVGLAGRFNENNVLPLKFQIFFILVGIHENNLENLILSGEETNLINILYKYKFLQISKLEKNRLYDIVLNKERPDLIGIIFHLYSDTFKGIRNIYPIHQRLLKQFDDLEDVEKKEFINSFQETGKYFQSYFLAKKVFSKSELKSWLGNLRKINGKNKPDSNKQFSGFNEKEDILKKYKSLLGENLIQSLSPFEILLLLDTNVSLSLKNEIIQSQQNSPNSYSSNRAYAVMCYYETDYKNFLLHIERAGSLKNHSECIYLKAMSLLETGYKKEAKMILLALHEKFPDATVIKETLKSL